MRTYFIFAVALFFLLLGSSGRAADWDLTMAVAQNAGEDKLTVLSRTKPFWVILTNKSDHAWTLPRYSETTACQYLDLTFLFCDEKTNEILVGIEKYSETWNLVGPEVVEPGKSYRIRVDLSLGDWAHVKDLHGLMKVKAVYQNPDNRITARPFPGKPPTWKGKVESSPIEVVVVT